MMNICFVIPDRPIPGLGYYPECITRKAEQDLLRLIDEHPWMNDLRRRVQHYGYRYDYTLREVPTASYLGEVPSWLAGLARTLHAQGFYPQEPDQIIINEYLPGQGIAPHIDRTTCFGGTIAVLSLCAPITMEFTCERTGEKWSQRLEPRSLAIMQGDARYKWRHGIRPRKSDLVDGVKVPRSRRISVTFRKVLPDRE
ncbi:MAG TPA: alpha-ketoglutarate-dependent dioxygenase AlkB [Rhizobiales bacterium]|nr:alpha-ketoglutarate-dependent dioxygenase AlkB [Hyphomicrobiales bacterium]